MNAQRSSSRVESLREVVAECRELLEETRLPAVDWKELVGREALLRERLTDLLSGPVRPSEGAAVRIALQEILTINDAAVQVIEARKADIVSSLQHKALVRRAAKAYGNAAVGA